MIREAVMRRFGLLLVLACLGLRGLAHPGSGIVVDRKGRVCFTDTGAGVWRVEEGGKLALVSSVAWH